MSRKEVATGGLWHLGRDAGAEVTRWEAGCPPPCRRWLSTDPRPRETEWRGSLGFKMSRVTWLPKLVNKTWLDLGREKVI